MTNEIKLQAELVMRQLQAQPGADQKAIALAFAPLLATIAAAQKRVFRAGFETKG